MQVRRGQVRFDAPGRITCRSHRSYGFRWRLHLRCARSHRSSCLGRDTGRAPKHPQKAKKHHGQPVTHVHVNAFLGGCNSVTAPFQSAPNTPPAALESTGGEKRATKRDVNTRAHLGVVASCTYIADSAGKEVAAKAVAAGRIFHRRALAADPNGSRIIVDGRVPPAREWGHATSPVEADADGGHGCRAGCHALVVEEIKSAPAATASVPGGGASAGEAVFVGAPASFATHRAGLHPIATAVDSPETPTAEPEPVGVARRANRRSVSPTHPAGAATLCGGAAVGRTDRRLGCAWTVHARQNDPSAQTHAVVGCATEAPAFADAPGAMPAAAR